MVKLFLKKPDSSQGIVQRVLNTATKDCDSPDVRDRAYIYWRLLSMDPAAAKVSCWPSFALFPIRLLFLFFAGCGVGPPSANLDPPDNGGSCPIGRAPRGNFESRECLSQTCRNVCWTGTSWRRLCAERDRVCL